MQEVSLLIGGQAGDGMMRAAELIGRIFNRLGLYAFVINDYGSLIRGGHNFCKIRAADRQIWHHRESVELIAAVNQDTIAKHQKELTGDGRVLYDEGAVKYEGPHEPLPIPLTTMIQEVGGISIMKNSAMIGAIASLYGVPLSVVEEVINRAYGEKAAKNIELVKRRYEFILSFPPNPLQKNKTDFSKVNQKILG